jgi:uncharacterized protein DUF2637
VTTTPTTDRATTGTLARQTGQAGTPAERARGAYRASLTAGRPLSGEKLGAQFGRSGRWGRAQIEAVRAESPAPSEHAGPAPDAGPAPVLPDRPSPAVPGTADAEPAPVAPSRRVRGATASAVLGLVTGVAASVAANVAHSFVPPANAGAGWTPPAGAVIAAAFWPLALFLAVEVLTRVPWRSGGWWAFARYGGVSVVALVAAIVSYRHMAALLMTYREDWISAHIGPFAVDGLMVVAGLALLTMSTRPGTTRAIDPDPSDPDTSERR